VRSSGLSSNLGSSIPARCASSATASWNERCS